MRLFTTSALVALAVLASRATAAPDITVAAVVAAPPAPAQAQPAEPKPSAQAEPATATPAACPGNPSALGVSRTVEIDTTGGPGFGAEKFREHDFLQPGEVVLTFDDGPWKETTRMVLAALAHHCTKAVFFSIGKHVTYHPEILQEVAAAGHTIGTHTWGHRDMVRLLHGSNKAKRKAKVEPTEEAKAQAMEEAKTEIELAVSEVRSVVGDAAAPFFRFPALRQPPELIAYLGGRNIAIFSVDVDSKDYKAHKGDKVVRTVMDKLKKQGKGIILMHDLQHSTAEGIAALLDQLKQRDYKVVFLRPKFPVTSLPQYDAMLPKELQPAVVSQHHPALDAAKTKAH